MSSIRATVVQFGLGHQIANLVTRVQIPAVAFSIITMVIDPISSINQKMSSAINAGYHSKLN
jgi:hypothetical protein